LITHAIKYAFPNGSSGEIRIDAKTIDQIVEVTVKDNGVGLPENHDWKNLDSLGLKLVRMLTENQLDGSLEWMNQAGLQFVIRFAADAEVPEGMNRGQENNAG